MLTQILSIHNYPPTNSHHFYVFSVSKYIFVLYSLNSIQTISICSFGKICVKVLSRKIILEWQRKFWKKLISATALKSWWSPRRGQGQADWCWLSLHIHHIQLKVQSSLKPESEKHHFSHTSIPGRGQSLREHHSSLNWFPCR